MGLVKEQSHANIRLEQTAGKSWFNVKVCRNPVQHWAAAQAGRKLH